jgi:uncharacterized protein YhbP (UPF0306 family)
VLRQAVQELLSQSTMTLATTGSAGEPHAAAVYFASDESINLYYFSDPSSQHVHDLTHDSRAAATIYPECKGWLDIRGLQLRGVVKPVEPGENWERVWQLYAEKFPFVKGLQIIVSRNQLYQFRTTWMRWTDNRLGFGHKEEWQRSDSDQPGEEGVKWRKLRAVDVEHENHSG